MRYFLATSLSIWLFLFSLQNALGKTEPVRNIEQLDRALQAEVVRVTTARVVLADYELLKKDFEVLRSKTNHEIDQWLLERTSFLTAAQSRQSKVNSKVNYTSYDSATGSSQAFRPYKYMRSLVYRFAEGLLDGKGAGSENPYDSAHGNGLASLAECIREYIYQKLIQKVLDHSGSGAQTVGCYAVIDWGFDAKVGDAFLPAGMVLRQAYERFKPHDTTGRTNPFLDKARSTIIEKILRTFGITSCGENYIKSELDIINLQATKEGYLIDFGAYLAQNFFRRDVYHYYDVTHHSIPDNGPLWETNHGEFPQPYEIPELLKSWGTSASAKDDPKYDNPMQYSIKLAANWRKGEAQLIDFSTHVHTMVDSLTLPEELRDRFLNAFSPENLSSAADYVLQKEIEYGKISYATLDQWTQLTPLHQRSDERIRQIFKLGPPKGLLDLFATPNLFHIYQQHLEHLVTHNHLAVTNVLFNEKTLTPQIRQHLITRIVNHAEPKPLQCFIEALKPSDIETALPWIEQAILHNPSMAFFLFRTHEWRSKLDTNWLVNMYQQVQHDPRSHHIKDYLGKMLKDPLCSSLFNP